MLEKWGMRRIIEPKRVEIKGDWGNCVMKSFEVFYSLDIVQVIMSRRIN